MDSSLKPGEKVIKEGPANHFRGFESVGGHLRLTNKCLRFVPHAFNIQRDEKTYGLKEIKRVGKRNTFFIIPNGIFIELKDGECEKFVVWNRTDWVKAIEELI